MKNLSTPFLILFVLFGCSPKNQSTESLIDEVEINELDDETYNEIIRSVSDENSKNFKKLDAELVNKSKMKSLLEFEKSALDNWIELPEYADTLARVRNELISEVSTRCATRDRAPISALRTPSPKVEKQTDFLFFNTSKIMIPIRVHIVNKNQGYIARDNSSSNPELHVSQRKVEEQLDILNNAFNAYNIFFSISSIDSINNTKWNESGMDYYSTKTLYEMLDHFSMTPESHMNLYIIDGRRTGQLILGEATFPWDLGANRFDDYVIISCRSLSDFYNSNNNNTGLGKTLIHEVGHYLGLWHTFEGGFECDHPNNDGCYYGDRVLDTPPQKFCHFGECDCDGKKCDTCLEDELADPVHNYMGYNDDACLNELSLIHI